MEPEDLLKLLNTNRVEYVIIGATAFPIHGYMRATIDLDLFIRPSLHNAEQAKKALLAFGYDIHDFPTAQFLKKKILIRQYWLETDIHPFVKGVSFNRIWKNKVRKKMGNTFTHFASLNDLIAMKRAAGRGQDLEDLAHLLKLRKRINAKKKQ